MCGSGVLPFSLQHVMKRWNLFSGAWLSLIWIVGMALLALTGYAWLPDSTPDANRMQVSLALLPPGSSVDFLKTHPNETSQSRAFFKGSPDTHQEIPFFSSKTVKKDSFFQIVLFQDLTDTPLLQKELPFSVVKPQNISTLTHRRTFWLGTDRYGRDVLSRLILGARISLGIGLVAVFISLVLGLFVGLTSGYFGGWTDRVLSWITQVVWSLPTILVVIAITLALGKGFWQVFLAVGLTMWVEVARMVRGQVMSIRNEEFVLAAKAIGASDVRIILRHVLPQLLGPLLVICTANFSSAILLESGLSFLGLGVQPPAPSWGQMIREHYGYIILDKPWSAIVPGAAIMMSVVAFNQIGQVLRDRMDIRTLNSTNT